MCMCTHTHTSINTLQRHFSHGNIPWQSLWLLECWDTLLLVVVPCQWGMTHQPSVGAFGWCPALSKWPQFQFPFLCKRGTPWWQFHLQQQWRHILLMRSVEHNLSPHVHYPVSQFPWVVPLKQSQCWYDWLRLLAWQVCNRWCSCVNGFIA